jgi:NADH-ubiquinone oxidoreductase chain 5
MYLTILTLPLLSSIASGILGRKLGVTGSHLVSFISILMSCLLSFVILFEVGIAGSQVSLDLGSWVESDFLTLSWEFSFDSLTGTMLIPILLISALVHCYSIGYMGGDPHQQRFFSYLSLFTFFMIVLTCADNLLLMFVGWEGVGICSYLLISFWFTRIQATKSGILAICVNRVGDWALTLGLFGLFWVMGSLDFSTVLAISPFTPTLTLEMIVIGFLIGAMAKSAQIGLMHWLPEAMEGPTPVSALLHAATMVVAGVYLLIRISPILESSENVLVLVVWIGALTSFIAAQIGFCQNDLKRVIAYSTTSQLGMMFMACGLGPPQYCQMLGSHKLKTIL